VAASHAFVTAICSVDFDKRFWKRSDEQKPNIEPTSQGARDHLEMTNGTTHPLHKRTLTGIAVEMFNTCRQLEEQLMDKMVSPIPSAHSLQVVMRPERHEHGRVVSEQLVVPVVAGSTHHQNRRPIGCPGPVPAPRELDVNGRPRAPVGRVVARRALELLVGELVPEVLRDEAQVWRVEAERLRGLHALERGRRRGEPVHERPAQAPRQQLVAQEVAGVKRARGHHALGQRLRAP
jgi:hypothetical protein